MTPFPTLETPRLLLREIVHADAPDLLAIHGNRELMRWFGTEPLLDLTAAEALVDTFAGWRSLPNPGTRWAIQLKGEPRLLGTCGLFAWNRAWKKCAIGYELATAVQGKGYMREALAAVLAWGFGQMDLNRIEAQVHPLNLASLRLLRTFGFVQEDCLREVGFWGGSFHDMLQFSLLQREHDALELPLGPSRGGTASETDRNA